MSTERYIPTFEVVRSGETTVVFTEPCPGCGRRHTHGISSVPGHVVGHCADLWKGRVELPRSPLRDSGYFLAWAPGAGPEGEG